MAQTFFFYDLETSGVNPRTSRIMQFAGQRTYMDLKPIGDPVNVLIKLTPDVVPEPDAIMITGITPQQTLQDGMTEAEFLKFFFEEICLSGTVFLGFNTMRFDDEFMRYTLYRNFYDPYEWQWKDDCSRWDLLDVVRMTRALRPEGIKWPFDTSGKPTNRLELLADLNGFDHKRAHDALSDVEVSIDLARLLKTKQPKLFEYLFNLRDKKAVAELVNAGRPFVYSSGKYSSKYEKTTVAVRVTDHPKRQGALLYDLRYDPKQYDKLSATELVELWKWKKDPDAPRLPVKTMRFNCCPAVAPLGVLDAPSQERLGIDLDVIRKHHAALKGMTGFKDRLLEALEIMDSQQQTSFLTDTRDVDGQLYDGFLSDEDRNLEQAFRAADPSEFSTIAMGFKDERLQALAPLYKARNYPETLTPDERKLWDRHCHDRLLGGGEKSALARYFARLGQLAESPGLTSEQGYLLEELQIYGQSILPADAEFGA